MRILRAPITEVEKKQALQRIQGKHEKERKEIEMRQRAERKIARVLLALEPEARVRILRAVALLYDIEIGPIAET